MAWLCRPLLQILRNEYVYNFAVIRITGTHPLMPWLARPGAENMQRRMLLLGFWYFDRTKRSLVWSSVFGTAENICFEGLPLDRYAQIIAFYLGSPSPVLGTYRNVRFQDILVLKTHRQICLHCFLVHVTCTNIFR
jgi:hypothetical protein